MLNFKPSVLSWGARCVASTALVVVSLAAAPVANAQLTWFDLTLATDPPIANPFKGFMNYSDSPLLSGSGEFPHTLEFFYIGMDEFWVDEGGGDWQLDTTALQADLDAIEGRGRQAVFRIFVDYPREQLACPVSDPVATPADTALPDHLMDGLGGDDVTLNYYCDASADLEGWSVDTSIEASRDNFLGAVQELLDELVAQFDGDPAIAFIQVGFLGHWGEWHTFFDPGDPLDCDLTTDGDAHETMNAVLDGFDAFDSTLVLVSADVLQCHQRPIDGTPADPGVEWFSRSIGIHDDDFANSTVCETYGLDTRANTWGAENDWVSLPVGGEVQPSLQGPIHNDDDSLDCAADPDTYDTGELDGATEATHPSFLLDYALFHGSPTLAQETNAEATARRMGYQYFVSAVALPDDPRTDEPLMLTVRVENLGVAPVYYALDVELVVLDGAVEVATLATDIYLEDVYDAPARGVDSVEFPLAIADHGLPAATYDLALRVPNPMAGGAALRFANAEQAGDLLMLGSVTLSDTPLFADGFETGDTTAWN